MSRPGGEPSAVVTIKVFSIGVPGQVIIEVETSGPAGLIDRETLTVLEQAADMVARKLTEE